MTMTRWDGSAQVDLVTAKRWDGVAQVDLTIAKRWDGAAWVDIPLPGAGSGDFSATASPGFVVGALTNNNLFITVSSNSVTVTPINGMAPYTHSWSRVSGDSAPQPSSTTAASVFFSANVARDHEYQAVWRDTITDSDSNVTTVDVSVLLIHNSTL